MSYNGSGTFNINSAGQPVVTGTVIASTAFNALTADLGTGLTTAITKDGQTTATARIPFAAGINSSLVTDATNTTTGSIITAGGVGVAKALFVGTTANIAGATTLAGVTATSITDSGTLAVTGATTLSSTLGVTGVATLGNGAILGTPASATLTNATGLPIASGVSGLGTGVATALAVNVGSAGAPVVNGGVLGTPSSGTVTNLTGTASININGTVGATTAAAGKFTSLSAITAQGVIAVESTTATNSVFAQFTNGGGTSYVGADTSTGSVFSSGAYGFTIFNAANAATTFFTNAVERMRITSAGNVGIGTGATVNYKLEVSTDSAGKPGVGGLWTVVSDERIKSNIVPANLDRCYEIVKSVPLKHFGFAPGVYTDDQIQDKHNLGWIAQDVQKVFKNAVSVKPFTLKTDIPDGTEEYEEQDFTFESIEKTETSIQVINGKAVQVSKVVTSENKVMLFDTVDVLDEAGVAVMDGDKPLTYQMPRMITKTRPKVRHDVIEDCLDLNSGQMIAALYGCVQALMSKVEALEAKV